MMRPAPLPTHATRLVLTVGEHTALSAERASGLGLEVRHSAKPADAAVLARDLVESNDLVLVKGSRGVRTELVVKALLEHHEASAAASSGQGAHA